MQDPIEPDRHETLYGPGDTRLAAGNATSTGKRQKKNTKKTTFIAASALVAVLAAGGVGYMLAANPSEAAQPGGGNPVPSQSVAGNDDPGGEDATMGDATVDDSDGDTSTGTGNDGTMGDAVTDQGSGGDNTAGTGSNPDRGTAQTNNHKTPSKSSPTKAPQSSDADTPADGPAGLVNGQCATSGC
ncbi:hypothetical protein GBF35_11045 [Nonomuraea phyllanthi]|uniref:hypothetical protein n=1 Tax=Nonomuraea phyllanthi TaxID=2219224 RepID=UPI001293DCDD|nr:hypothetical protein [Nonomuraea phyllanthi]QFY07152.1 hypothetical protein GBF35_11045 [Nonomuraea phyllanthi]